MNTRILIGLIIVSIMAILVDCYAGYGLFLMTAMPIGFYLSPMLLLFLVVSIPTIFIASVIGLFRFKKWAYWMFFALTFLLHSFLVCIYIYDLVKGYDTLRIKHIFPMVSYLMFIIYFFLPSARRLFK
jgi:hypothetical protein